MLHTKHWWLMLVLLLALTACDSGGRLTSEQRDQTQAAGTQAAATELALAATATPTNTATATVTALPSNTPTALPTETPTSTATNTATASLTPSETPNVQRTVESAVAASLTAQPPTETALPSNTPAPTEIALLPINYQQVTLRQMQLALAVPQGWTVEESAQEALAQSPNRETGVVIQRGSQTELARLGLLGRDADLTQAMQNISLLGQAAQLDPIESVLLDNLGISGLRLAAEDSSSFTLAYLFNLSSDDYLLLVGYSPRLIAPQFEVQIMTPLILSLDQLDQTSQAAADTSAPPTLPATEVAQAEPTNAPPTLPATEAAQLEATEASTVTPVPSESSATDVPPTENAAPTEAPATEVAQGPADGLTNYNSRALQLSFDHPADAIVEQDGPLVLVNSPADENARVVFVRGTPDFLVQSEIIPTADDPSSALTELVQESIGEDIPVQSAELFGSQTFFVDIDLPNVFARYYLVQFETEWVFILTVAPKGGAVDFQADFIDPILNSLVISPPVVIEEVPDVEFPLAYTSQTTGLLTGLFEDTIITEDANTVTADFGTGQIVIYFGKPAELLERGLISSDLGLISALKSIAEGYGITEVEVKSERILRFDRSAFVEFEVDGLHYVYIGAIWREPDDWMIVELQIEAAQYEEFNRTVFSPWVKQLDVDPALYDASRAGASAPTEASSESAEIQPTYTPQATYTPQPTYTQPAPAGN